MQWFSTSVHRAEQFRLQLPASYLAIPMLLHDGVQALRLVCLFVKLQAVLQFEASRNS
jgi:hypothetical protein